MPLRCAAAGARCCRMYLERVLGAHLAVHEMHGESGKGVVRGRTTEGRADEQAKRAAQTSDGERERARSQIAYERVRKHSVSLPPPASLLPVHAWAAAGSG